MSKGRALRMTGSRDVGSQALEAYLTRNGRMFAHYIYLKVGSRTETRAIMAEFARRLGVHWEHTLQQAAYEAHVWRLLREHVDRWLTTHAREPRVAERFARKKAEARGQLRDLKKRLSADESALGLYQALSTLSEHQFDIMALRFLLHQEAEDIAAYLGINVGTVYSTINQAKDALARNASVCSLLHPKYRPATPEDIQKPHPVEPGDERL